MTDGTLQAPMTGRLLLTAEARTTDRIAEAPTTDRTAEAPTTGRTAEARTSGRPLSAVVVAPMAGRSLSAVEAP